METTPTPTTSDTYNPIMNATSGIYLKDLQLALLTTDLANIPTLDVASNLEALSVGGSIMGIRDGRALMAVATDTGIDVIILDFGQPDLGV